jgi:hypothetical protein
MGMKKERRRSRVIVGRRAVEDPFWPLGVFGVPPQARALLLVTKPTLPRLFQPLAKSERCLFLCRYGVPSRGTLRTVRWFSTALGLPISFVGELHPVDLWAFVAYRSVPMQWGGINDAWLSLCEGALKREYTLDSVCIRMSAVEKAHFKALEQRLPELEAIIGRQSIALLRSGRILAIEGASNPDLYKRGFRERLLEHLMRRSPSNG